MSISVYFSSISLAARQPVIEFNVAPAREVIFRVIRNEISELVALIGYDFAFHLNDSVHFAPWFAIYVRVCPRPRAHARVTQLLDYSVQRALHCEILCNGSSLHW